MNKYRFIQDLALESLNTFRVVSLTGARQVGKTTLAKALGARRGMGYVSLEDATARVAAQADPEGWLAAQPSPLVIDEIQHVPALFPAIKQRVDRSPAPGQYLITGSALWLSMKRVGESLAGRVAVLDLWPFALAERLEREPAPLERLCARNLDLAALRAQEAAMRGLPPDWLKEAVLAGGFPEPSGYVSARQRSLWFESYLGTYLQRDVIDLVRVEHASAYLRLVRLVAARSGQLLNVSALAAELQVPQPTLRRYVQWLQTTYQCFEIQPYSANVGKRLVKTPKCYWSDSGMAAGLLGFRAWPELDAAQMAGPLIETWVAGELRKWRSWAGGTALSFWRTHGGYEADFLLEHEGAVTAVEVKAGNRLDARDLQGLKECRAALGRRFRRGIVLYGGCEVVPLDETLLAVPLAFLAGQLRRTSS